MSSLASLDDIFPPGTIYAYDLETYPNYFLAVFHDGSQFIRFDHTQIIALKYFIANPTLTLVGYNNKYFDDPILKAIHNTAAEKLTPEFIHDLAERLIHKNAADQQINHLIWRENHPWGRSIDLMQVLRTNADGDSSFVSLKERGIRIDWANIQDLPYDPYLNLTSAQQVEVADYCRNDVAITWRLLELTQEDVALRHAIGDAYQINVLSESDAAVAEKLLLELYARQVGLSVPEVKKLPRLEQNDIPVASLLPSGLAYHHPRLEDLLKKLRSSNIITDAKQNVRLHIDGQPVESLRLTLDNQDYALGLGGLHSCDDAGIWTDDQSLLVDIDATSYYPAILINRWLHPTHLTSAWTGILQQLTAERVEAKKSGDKRKAQSLKIVTNSCFGKSGSRYSFMYDPALAYAITLTGQLLLLRLMDLYLHEGMEIISTNTDGITIRVPRDKRECIEQINRQWQQETGIPLETTYLKKIVRLHINAYVAQDENGAIKTKGMFGVDGLKKKAGGRIVSKALVAYFIHGVPVEQTIGQADDIHDFLYSNKSPRMTWGGVRQQKNVRWYVSTQGRPIVNEYLATGTTKARKIRVHNGEHAMVCNHIEFPAMPDDLDRMHYIREARKWIAKVDAACSPLLFAPLAVPA